MPTTSLVRASRDGDQFHYLWAARRCLQLLSAQSDLVAISIEGPSSKERVGGAASRAGEEVIDVGEYFGSEDIRTARLVRYVQLKHSTLHPTKPWTASGLEKTIKGFTRRYQEQLRASTAESLGSKLEFWFVTNRPVSRGLTETIFDISTAASPRHPAELRKIERCTGLSGASLTAFARLLRIEDQQDSYWEQRNILFQDVTGYLPDGDVDAPTRLKELVTRKALSEGEANPTITKIDVLRALNTDESRLFPARCLIQTLDAAVPRAQEQDLHREIMAAGVPVIIHALAGVGKTVFATRIGRSLPQGSTCVLYDCFGNGQYRNASGYRHRHKDALVQIANELAASGLCHPIVPTAHADASAYVRAFVHRVTQAATLLRLSKPGALLCIVVDAADNAQMAAEEIGEARSFVRDIVREKMPANVRLVFLCRSHRQAYLDPPVYARRLELLPFTRDETANFLRQSFPAASAQDIDEFHRLSSQNPRVQALALSRNNTLREILRLLGPNPTTVEDTIGHLLRDAIVLLRDSVGPVEKAQLDGICTGLAALRPLIPVAILSRISGVEQAAIKSFAIDLGRPLLLAGETIQFLDEPAETWFRETFRPSAEAMKHFIGRLRPLAATSAYVASVLPQLMLEAGEFTELVDLALASGALPETSPLERRDVELQRLQFALKAGLRSKRYIEAAKLALKAGGESAGDDRQRRLLQANTDLAAAFLDSGVIQDVVSRRPFGAAWRGSHYAYEAALLSGRPELLGDARSHLRMAYEWLRNWSRLTPDERQEERLEDQDIVALTLAHMNIDGAEYAAARLGEWRPREVVFRVGRIVARRLIDHGRVEDVVELGKAAGNNLALVLAVVVELWEIQQTLPIDVALPAFHLLTKRRVKLRERPAWEDEGAAFVAVTSLVESALHFALCSVEEAEAVLSRQIPKKPSRALSSRLTKTRFAWMRAYCLQAALKGRTVKLRDLAHAGLRAEMDKNASHSTSRDLREFQEDVGALLPWHRLWANALLGRVTKASLEEDLRRAQEASSRVATTYFTDDFHTSNDIAVLWVNILQKVDATNQKATGAFLRWKSELKRPLFTPTLTALARLCGQNEVSKSSALEFALEAFNLTKDERSDAESKAEGYVDVARAILAVSSPDAKAYFNQAVEVASKIGDENLSRWDAILDLAGRAARADRPSPELAYQFARCAELTYDYVARDKHFNWRATVQALAGLCQPSTLAILSRWRDRKFGSPGRLLPIAVECLIDRDSLDPEDALPLLAYRSRWAYDRLLDRVLTRCKTRRHKEAVAQYLLRYMQFAEGDFSKLKDVASEHGLVLPGLEVAISIEERRKQAERGSVNPQVYDPESAPLKSSMNWQGVFGARELTSPDGLARAFAAFNETEVPRDRDEFFGEMIRRVPAGSEVAFIEAFGSTPDFDLYDLRRVLERAPQKWEERLAIAHALAATIKAYCRRDCMTITRNRYYEALPFKLASRLARISEAEIAQVVLTAIGQSPEPCDANRLFSLVGLLALQLSEDEALDALAFGLDLFAPVLEDKDGDGAWSGALLPPTDVKASVAGYIWASMAAPEATLRWEGAHAVRGLAVLGRGELLRHVVAYAVAKQGGSFVDARLPFYSLHGTQWLLIGMARAAAECPEALSAFGTQIVAWALDDQPHVLIRQFAARAALALVDHGAFVVSDYDRKRLASINISSLPVVSSGLYERSASDSVDSSSEDEDGYYFGIDIGPYWLQPLGRVFGLSQKAIEALTLKVIRTDFAYTQKGRWDEDERRKRKLYAAEHTYHSHGSHPRADALDFYHGYHAMMMVAGQLLASVPTHADPIYGEADEFAAWLDRHDLSRPDDRWLWDRRDPTPPEEALWQSINDDATWRTITSAEVDEAVHTNGMANVWGDWTVANAERQVGILVRSALVSRDKSLALLRALGTAKDASDYALPSTNSDLEINDPEFVLKGWVSDDSGDRGLDAQDRWAGGITFPPPTPASRIVDRMGLTTDSDCRMWRSKQGETVMTSQVWGHYDEGNRYEVGNPERGSRLQASPEFLTSMLAILGCDLIIQVQIDRGRTYRPYESGIEDDKNKIPKQVRLYLLGADGRFRTL